MKKFHCGVIFGIVLTISVILPLKGFAGSSWVLYDNFNSGSFDPALWELDNFPAAITIEGGRAKFVDDLSNLGNSSWLIFNKNPENIKEIRVKVWIEEAPDGDITSRARIGGFVGEDESENPIFIQLRILPGRGSVECIAIALDPEDFDIGVYELFFGRFINPVDIIDERFKLTLEFDRDELECEESNLGEIEYELEDELERTDDPFKGIGTRIDGDIATVSGQFVVYFDDVYVRYSD
jgi:hypothetical protein